MKKLMLFAVLLGILFTACKKEPILDLDPGLILGYSTDMGPLNTVNKVCNAVLCFEDETHFRNSYDYLEGKYDSTSPTDSTAYLDFFEDQKDFKSLRRHVENLEKQMEAQNIPITDANDPDKTFFEDDVMKTFLNEDKLVKIGDTVVLYLDECVIFKAPFEDCRGVTLMSQFSKLIEQNEIEAANQFMFDNPEIQIENICDSGSERGNCGIVADFQTSINWTADPDFVEVTLDANAYSDRPILFIKWGFRYESGIDVIQGELFDVETDILGIPIRIRLVTGRTVILKVPRSKDFFEVSYRATNLLCSNKITKRINIACGININRSYGLNDNVTFTVDHNPAIPITGFNWIFGDGATGTGSTVTHQYTYSGCGGSFDVYVIPQGTLPPECSSDIGTRVKLGWRKYRSSGSKTERETLNGQKVKWKIKQNGDRLLGKNKIKAKIKARGFRARADFDISYSGNIYLDNPTCSAYDLSTVSSTSGSNKKRLKNVYKRSDKFNLKLTDIYTTHFTVDGTAFDRKLQASSMAPE